MYIHALVYNECVRVYIYIYLYNSAPSAHAADPLLISDECDAMRCAHCDGAYCEERNVESR